MPLLVGSSGEAEGLLAVMIVAEEIGGDDFDEMRPRGEIAGQRSPPEVRAIQHRLG